MFMTAATEFIYEGSPYWTSQHLWFSLIYITVCFMLIVPCLLCEVADLFSCKRIVFCWIQHRFVCATSTCIVEPVSWDHCSFLLNYLLKEDVVVDKQCLCESRYGGGPCKGRKYPVWCQIQQLSSRWYNGWQRGSSTVMKSHTRPVLKMIEHSRVEQLVVSLSL